MTDIQIFNNPAFGKVRTVIENNEVYFVGKDVALILGYAKPQNAIAKHVDKEDALKRGTPTNGGTQEMLFVNESGLYNSCGRENPWF